MRGDMGGLSSVDVDGATQALKAIIMESKSSGGRQSQTVHLVAPPHTRAAVFDEYRKLVTMVFEPRSAALDLAGSLGN